MPLLLLRICYGPIEASYPGGWTGFGIFLIFLFLTTGSYLAFVWLELGEQLSRVGNWLLCLASILLAGFGIVTFGALAFTDGGDMGALAFLCAFVIHFPGLIVTILLLTIIEMIAETCRKRCSVERILHPSISEEDVRATL